MSITKIKELASTLKSGKALSIMKTSIAFGNKNIRNELQELLNLIEEYKEPDPVKDTPPKSRTRRARTPRKEETT